MPTMPRMATESPSSLLTETKLYPILNETLFKSKCNEEKLLTFSNLQQVAVLCIYHIIWCWGAVTVRNTS